MLINALKNRVIIVILIGFLALLLAWTMPRAAVTTMWQDTLETTSPSGEVLQSDTPSDLPAYRERTNGIVIGGVILVLIVVGGSLGAIRRQD